MQSMVLSCGYNWWQCSYFCVYDLYPYSGGRVWAEPTKPCKYWKFWQQPMLEIIGKQNLKDTKLITPSYWCLWILSATIITICYYPIQMYFNSRFQNQRTDKLTCSSVLYLILWIFGIQIFIQHSLFMFPYHKL